MRTLKRIDYLLLATPLALGVISVIMLHSIRGPGDRMPIVQAIAFGLGTVAMVVLAFFDNTYFKRLERWLYPFAIFLQFLVFTPLGVNINGQRNWLDLGFTTLQPSEFVKIIFVLTLSAYLTRNRESLFTFKGLSFAFLYSLPLIGLVGSVDMGSGIVMMAIFIGMVFVAGLRGSLLLRLSGIFVILIPVFYRFLGSYQQDRITAFLHPDNFDTDATYQVHQSKIAIGSGGFFGKGLGNGTIKSSGFLPVQESDFIYSIICEELGFLGGGLVIALYFIMLFRMWVVVRRSREVYSALVVVGFICMLGFQIFENVGMVMGLMPVTGITLPFLSQGGTSALADMMIIGIVLGIGAENKVKSYKRIQTH